MTASQRRHYRVTGDDLNGIEVTMKVGEHRRPVHLMDISAAGAAIAFLEAKRGDVESLLRSSRDVPTVRIVSGRLTSSLDIPCRIAHVQEVSSGVVCGVAFLRRIDETLNLDRALLRIFNRRGAVRVEPDAKQAINVAIDDAKGSPIAAGFLRDLSLTGIGVTVPPDRMAAVPNGTHVRLRFSVDGEPFDLNATVRFGKVNTVVLPGDVVPHEVGMLGIEFDENARNHPDTRKRLANWVMRRQREIQRMQREAAGAPRRR